MPQGSYSMEKESTAAHYNIVILLTDGVRKLWVENGG
jgi:hypothetical protein